MTKNYLIFDLIQFFNTLTNPYLVFLNHLTVRSAWKPTQFSFVGSLVHHNFSYPLCNQNDFCCAPPKANSFTVTYIKWMLCLCTFLYRLIVRNVYKWTGIDMGYSHKINDDFMIFFNMIWRCRSLIIQTRLTYREHINLLFYLIFAHSWLFLPIPLRII